MRPTRASTRSRSPSATALRALALVTVVVLVAGTACTDGGGGGGRLAEQEETVETPTPGAPVPVERLDAPTSPREALEALTEVETRLRSDDRDATTLPEVGRRQQLAYRSLAANPGWAARVLAGVPERIRAAVQANVDADAALNELTGDSSPPTMLPDWQIHPPQPAATLRGFYEEAQAASGIPWPYLAAIHLVETRMGRIHGNSSAGAQGPMQFIPTTWEAYGEGDVTDDRDAILAAGRYLDDRGGPDDMDSALFAYNNDTRYVRAVQAYASVMLDDPRSYDGYHAWQVIFAKADGPVLLPEGFGAP